MRRIQGTEHEYTLYCKRLTPKGFDPHSISLEILRDSELHLAGEFTTNGSRCYYDVGHLEVSTCEVSNAFDMVVWEKAGEKIVDWLRRVAEEKYLSDDEKIWAFKNNTSPDGTSYGSHENYLLDRSVSFPDKLVSELVPHLSTRFIYSGAGDILDGKYVISPMIYLTSAIVSGETMHNTGLINTRDEPHSSRDQWRRLHVICGDALMNETAILLRNFTTAAILQLIEMDKLGDVPKLSSPVDDMWRNVEKMNPDEWKVQINVGKEVSPVEIQRYYLGKIENIVGDDRERRAFRMFEEVLDGIENKRSKELARRIEWLDRYYAIAEAKEKKEGSEVEMMACKQYSEIGNDRGIFYRRQSKGLVDRFITDEEIVKAVTEPPPDTRAALRKEISDRFNIESIDWSTVVVNDGRRRTINLPDPYACRWEDLHGTAG